MKQKLGKNSSKGWYALGGMLVLVCNLMLGACGQTSPTAVSASTGNILPGLNLTTTASTTAATTTAALTTASIATAVTTTSSPTVTADNTPATSLTTQTAATDTPVVAPTPTIATPEAAATPLSGVQKYSSVFANYQENAPSVQAAVKAYSVSPDLANIPNIKDFKLSDQEKQLLAKNDFVIEPANFKQFYQAYESYRYDQIPTFVSTDSVLHVYHLIFDKILRDTERNYLIKDLTQLNILLYDYVLKQYNQLKGGPLDTAVKRELVFVAVARKLNTPNDNFSLPNEVLPEVNAEIKLVAAHQGEAPSPMMATDNHTEDYSQYVPRGHYTKTPEQEQYFRAMTWYGRMNFRLKNDSETQTALLLAQAISVAEENGRKARDYWSLIYEPTSFFVGTSDDLTYIDYMNLAKAVWGNTALSNPTLFADATKLAVFQKATDALPPPKINSMFTRVDTPETRDQQTKGFRVMGQRFTIDAYVFQQLVWRDVGNVSKPRDLPRALDFFAALGSTQAYTNLAAQNQNQYEHYDTQLTKVKTQLANVGTDTWTQNLYWAWLYNLRPLMQSYGQGYPSFMQTQAWQNKMLLTGLGSYTELKHDTILYAKQVLAERGGGPEDLPLGYVEPMPEFYARMEALLKMTKAGLQQRNLLENDMSSLLDNMVKDTDSLKVIATKELNGQAISDAEKQLIAYWGANLETITYAAADTDPNGQGRKNLDQQDSALVADIATGLNSNVLEEGTGHPSIIYVAVPINGKIVLSQGAVYSQYEFVQPASNRLTDEQWQQMLIAGKAPPLEAWKQSIMAPGLPKQ